MSAEARTCSSCGMGQDIPLRPGAVECHALPPTVVLVPGQGMVAVFPQCHGNVSCGFWTEKGVGITNKSTEKTTGKPTEKANGTT